MLPVFSFIGPHKVGKTTVLCGVLKELSRRGLRVGVIKSSKEASISEKPGSDTVRLAEAGAKEVIFWGQAKTVIFKDSLPKEDLSFWTLVSRHFSDVDLVLVEGLKKLVSLPKIEISRREQKETPFFRQGFPGIIAVAANYSVQGLPCFVLDDYQGLADFILSRLPKRHSKIELIVDGRPIPLTRFVEKALSGTIRGFLQSLRGIKDLKEIEIRLKF